MQYFFKYTKILSLNINKYFDYSKRNPLGEE